MGYGLPSKQTVNGVGRISKDKPYTLYSYRLDPCPSFLANGHLLRQAW